MKQIIVPFLALNSDFPALADVSAMLDNLNVRNSISEVNWNTFPYKPSVEFSIGYTEKELLIKYYVREEYFKAEKTLTNENVFEDSCVELFIAPSDDGIYYNIEFNGIGTCLAGVGSSRHDRIRLDAALIDTIRRESSAGKDPVAEIRQLYTWTLVAALPWSMFYLHKITSLQGKLLRANFYKCGDKLSVPHYLTWNPVTSGKPDFHRPECFGGLKFPG